MTLLTSRLVDPDKREGTTLLDLAVDNAVRGTNVNVPSGFEAWLVDVHRNGLATKPFDQSVQDSWNDKIWDEEERELPIAIIISVSCVHHDRDALPSADVSSQ